MDLKAVARIETNNYKSIIEELYATQGVLVFSDEYGEIHETRYEPSKLRIHGGWYTPDFMHVMKNGYIFFIEVKGSKHQRNYRAARAKLRATASYYPFFTFVEVVIKASRNTITQITFEEIK